MTTPHATQDRVCALLERASLALAHGDKEQAARLVNAAWSYATSVRDWLADQEREARVSLAEVGC